MTKKNVWVSPTGDGNWKVQRENAQRASKVTSTKAEAERAARDMAKRDNVELIVQRQDGQIQSKDSFGNDPLPPRDTEH